jgi:hypothetical protein
MEVSVTDEPDHAQSPQRGALDLVVLKSYPPEQKQ